MLVVDQIEVARRGGPCARYPTSCIVRDLLGQAGLLKPFQHLHVIDLTYGQGIFYYAIRSKVKVFAVDIEKLDWVVKPMCFTRAPAQAWERLVEDALTCLGGQVDVVVVDPPWQECKRGNGCRGYELGGRYHYRVSRAVGSPESILESARSLAKYLGVPVLYHYKQTLDGEHLAGPVAFRPFFHVINPRASDYRSYFGVVKG